MTEKLILFPRRAYHWVNKPRWGYEKGRYYRESGQYERRWFWPGQRVRVEKHRIPDEPGVFMSFLALLFFPLLILYVLGMTKQVDFYEVID